MLYRYLFILPFVKRLFFPIKTEPSLNVTSFIGKWNQVATSRSTTLFGTGPKYKNVTAYYNTSYNKELNQTVISVFNCGISPKNIHKNISGYSYVNSPCLTKRKLHFDGVKVDGNYWIIKLGPIINNKYEYVVISGPLSSFFGTRFSLYVLARNVEKYKKIYENEVRNWCKDQKFIFFWNKYISTV